MSVGDPLAEIETDKVSLEIEATESGVLSRTHVEEGATVPIGTAIATIGEEVAEDVAAQAPAAAPEEVAAAAEPEAAPVAAPAPEPVAAPAAAAASGTNGRAAADVPAPAPVAATSATGERLRASPLVKRLAAEHGIDLSSVTGTGPGGRIVRDDIAALLTGAPRVAPAPEAEPAAAAAPSPAPAAARTFDLPDRPAGVPREMSTIRRRTGQRMADSMRTAPHF